MNEFLKDLTEDQRFQINKSIGKYKSIGIDITFHENGIVKISQNRMYNGLILTNKQLYDRCKKIFHGTGLRPKIQPNTYVLDFSEVTPSWIENKMDKYDIKRDDIIKQLGIDKTVLSTYLSDKRGLTNMGKAAFYYYFLTYELNTELRDI